MSEQAVLQRIERRRVRKLPRPANPHLDASAPGLVWYAVMTEPQREEDADRDLRRQRYWTFFPHRREMVKVGRFVFRDIVRPLFPNYLFVGVRPGMGLGLAARSVGVAMILGIGGVPLPIPDPVITEIMERCDGGREADEIAPERRGRDLAFGGKPGDKVVLGAEAGAWHGLCQQILRIEGSKVILDWVHGELAVGLHHIAELIPAREKICAGNANTNAL
jgi:transcription antitermination factor NusG